MASDQQTVEFVSHAALDNEALIQGVAAALPVDQWKALRLLNRRWGSVVSCMVRALSMQIGTQMDTEKWRGWLQRMGSSFPSCRRLSVDVDRRIDRIAGARALAELGHVGLPLTELCLRVPSDTLTLIVHLEDVRFGPASVKMLSLELQAVERRSLSLDDVGVDTLLDHLPNLRHLVLHANAAVEWCSLYRSLACHGRGVERVELGCRLSSPWQPEWHPFAALTSIKAMRLHHVTRAQLRQILRLPRLDSLALDTVALCGPNETCMEINHPILPSLTSFHVHGTICDCIWSLVSHLQNLTSLRLNVEPLVRPYITSKMTAALRALPRHAQVHLTLTGPASGAAVIRRPVARGMPGGNALCLLRQWGLHHFLATRLVELSVASVSWGLDRQDVELLSRMQWLTGLRLMCCWVGEESDAEVNDVLMRLTALTSLRCLDIHLLRDGLPLDTRDTIDVILDTAQELLVNSQCVERKGIGQIECRY